MFKYTSLKTLQGNFAQRNYNLPHLYSLKAFYKIIFHVLWWIRWSLDPWTWGRKGFRFLLGSVLSCALWSSNQRRVYCPENTTYCYETPKKYTFTLYLDDAISYIFQNTDAIRHTLYISIPPYIRQIDFSKGIQVKEL